MKSDREHHFCSNNCRNESMRSGILKEQLEKYFMENYGVVNPRQIPDVEIRIQKICEEKYGPGITNVSQAFSIKQQKATTMLENFGVVNNWCRPEVRAQSRQTCKEKYGNEIPAHCPSILANMRSDFARQKRFLSWQRNGTIRASKVERRFVEFLKTMFDDVHHQVTVDAYSIDAYIGDVDVYVQIDGVFWHGLDRPLNVIQERAREGSMTDAAILKKYFIDRRADDHFIAKNLRLVRITDKEILSAEGSNSLRELIVRKIERG